MRLTCKILIVLLLAYAAGFVITVTFNPEVRFWSDAIRSRDQVIDEIRRKSPDKPIIFFTGGSSCAFSVDPEIIEKKTGLPAVNLGLPVASGRDYILHQALRRCQPGDYLVLALEPDMICFPDTNEVPSRLGYGLEASLGNPFTAAMDAAGGSLEGTSGWLSVFRPGARYFMVFAGRTLGGKGYRYKKADFRYRGRMETPIKLEEYEPGTLKTARSLDTAGRDYLKRASELAARKGVHISYSMPWRLTLPEALVRNREANRDILTEVSTILPTLPDVMYGSIDNPSLFSDSEWHLDAAGSSMRSTILASAVQDWLQSSR